jgi:LmbE family N-acetylglucosaminyl deacetylase
MSRMRRLFSDPPSGLRLLAIGAHPDDIEIGCAGTILRLVEERRLTEVAWVVFSGTPDRQAEARSAATRIVGDIPAEVVTHGFRDGFLPHTGVDVKEAFEELAAFQPDLILTHRGDDLHQDHAFVGALTWQTFRDHLILEYEIPKWDGDLTTPDLYVELTDAQIREKIRILSEAFGSQAGRHWFSEETFRGLARIRGIESRAADGYAEGFHARKLVW